MIVTENLKKIRDKIWENFITDSPIACLGCYAPVDGSYLCSSCGWPVCNPQCEANPAHKHAECKIFRESGAKFQPMGDLSLTCLQLECITPLRVLLAKEKNPERWAKEVAMMQDHSAERREKPIWQYNQVNVVEYLRGPCKLGKFSEDLIHSVCGILEVNAFESRTENGYPIRCLYPKLAILSHNCVSNISHSICYKAVGSDDDYKLVLTLFQLLIFILILIRLSHYWYICKIVYIFVNFSIIH